MGMMGRGVPVSADVFLAVPSLHPGRVERRNDPKYVCVLRLKRGQPFFFSFLSTLWNCFPPLKSVTCSNAELIIHFNVGRFCPKGVSFKVSTGI